MLGKTHMAVGTAAGLLIMQPQNITELILGTGAAMIGSVISDIDIGTSDSHKEVDKIIGFTVFTVIAIILMDSVWHLGIWQRLLNYTSIRQAAPSVAAFFVICAIGKEQPHRSFMHSFLACGMLTGCVAVFLPLLAPYFGIAFLSHLAIDVLNKKGERLLFPFRKGFQLGLCSSKGTVNRLMFRIGILVTIGCIAFHLSEIYHLPLIYFSGLQL